MINQINRPFTLQEDDTEATLNVKLWGFMIAIVLTLFASLLWTGISLVGISLLSLAFGLIIISLINQRKSGVANWGTVIAGQLLGVSGILILLITLFL